MSGGTAPWLLLRGLMRDRRHWGGFVERFAAQFPDADTLTLDFPGNGERHAEQSLATIDQTSDFCRAELRRRGVAPPYRVLAMSMGAMVAASWAARYPQEIAACVLINTSLRPFSRFWERLRPGVYPSVLKMALRGDDAEAAEALVLRLTSTRRDAGVLADWAAWRRQQPVSKPNALRQLAAAMRYVAPRTPPATRLLILAGAGDRLVNPRCSHRLAAAWNAELRVHASAGHDLPLDDADWVLREVRAWAAAPSGDGHR